MALTWKSKLPWGNPEMTEFGVHAVQSCSGAGEVTPAAPVSLHSYPLGGAAGTQEKQSQVRLC